jgi:hypothetical protein
LLDAWMPAYDFAERHATRVAAPRDAVWRALVALDPARLPVMRVLMALRALPGLVASPREALRRLRRPAASRGLRALLDGGFAPLAEEPERELVLGLTGRFWSASGGLVATPRESFREPPPAGLARAAWGFALADAPGGGTLLTTETRIRCGDARSRRAFGRYWALIRPGSGIIRREMLRAVRREAERRAAS